MADLVVINSSFESAVDILTEKNDSRTRLIQPLFAWVS
jgi:hypothetical protein